MTEDNITLQELAAKIEDASSKQDEKMHFFISEFKALDSDLVSQAEDVWNDNKDAMEWLITHHALLGMSPIKAVANGRREEVLKILHSLKYGLPV